MSEPRFRLDNMLSALVGGLAGGLLVWALVPKPAEPAPTPDGAVVEQPATPEAPAGAPESGPGGESEGERIQRLEASIRGLQARVTEQSKVDVYEEAEGEEGKRVTLSAADPKFQNAVRAVIDKAKWEAEQEERDKRDEQQDQRIARQLDDLIEVLDLSDQQADQVEVVLEAQAQFFRSLREGENRPVTRKDWQDRFAEAQAETKKKLGEILDADQLAAYEKHQEEQWGGWGRPPARGNR